MPITPPLPVVTIKMCPDCHMSSGKQNLLLLPSELLIHCNITVFLVLWLINILLGHTLETMYLSCYSANFYSFVSLSVYWCFLPDSVIIWWLANSDFLILSFLLHLLVYSLLKWTAFPSVIMYVLVWIHGLF